MLSILTRPFGRSHLSAAPRAPDASSRRSALPHDDNPGQPLMAARSPSTGWPDAIGPGPALLLPPDPPVLRLVDVPIDETALGSARRRIGFEARPGELVLLAGGSRAQRWRVLALAAGLASPPVGLCEVLGQTAGPADGRLPRRWPPQALGHVLHDGLLPARLPVPGFVAAPLLQAGESTAHALRPAELELYLLGAGALRGRRPESLSLTEARLARLARAMVVRPALLVLAWPDAGLPAESTEALRQALRTLACTFGTCVLLASEHPRLQASADRRVQLDAPRPRP